MRNLLKKMFPGTWSELRRQYRKWRYRRLTRQIIRKQGLEVASGPFRGMHYIDESHGSSLIPKILGSYEEELHAVLEPLIKREFPVVIDIGCGEGYYAVGLAMAKQRSIIYAFDADAHARAACLGLAVKNNVQNRVVIGGKVDTRILSRMPLHGSLVVCDCEGCEVDVLDPQKVPELVEVFMIIEVHDFFNPKISTTLQERFSLSHRIQPIRIAKRNPMNYSALCDFTAEQQKMALDENRMIDETTSMPQWFFLSPRDG